jgi:hypothetical protein
MSSSIGLVPTRRFASTIAIALALCFWGTIATAQVTIQPKAEVFAGYSWLHPGGDYADGIKTQDHTEGVNESLVYYLPQAHNLGVLFDFSQHFGSVSHQDINIYDAGLQYKYHTDSFSPFVQAFAGAEQQKVFSYSQWNAALGVGGGFDYAVGHRFSIRVAQADYIYSNFHTPAILGGNNHQWNSVRLSSGIIFNLGSYYVPQPTAACTAQPSEVWAGDPVTATATGSNFNPKHTIMYSWTTNGGRLSATDKQSTQIDTSGVAPGTYSANASLTDPRLKNVDAGSHSFIGRPDPVKPALCSAPFTIKQPQPPTVTCTADPTTIAVGQSSTITMNGNDPQGWPLTYSWSTSSGQLSGGTASTTTLTATSADAGTTMTVTGTVTDARANLSATCTATVNSPQVISCAKIEDWGECTFEKNPKKPWRVDNDCKDTLDKVALRLQQMPNGKLDVLGYTDEKEVVTEKTLGAQRSVNVKFYLTTDGPTKIDPSRIQPRDGGTQGKATHFYFVPENLCTDQSEQGTAVDESQVKPQSRNATVPKKRSHKAKSAAPAASAPAQ